MFLKVRFILHNSLIIDLILLIENYYRMLSFIEKYQTSAKMTLMSHLRDDDLTIAHYI